MRTNLVLTQSDLSIQSLEPALRGEMEVSVDPRLIQKVEETRKYLEDKISSSKDPIYGVNTGFGSLCNIEIGPEAITKLQSNLIRSHACGCGDTIPKEIARVILFLKIRNLSYGKSGVRKILLNRLIDWFNADRIPVIYELGSLGASGDLAPLAHMSLPLLGEGHFYGARGLTTAAEVNEKHGWKPIELQAKEGLALINGTQFSTAFGVWASLHGKRLLSIANACAALSYEGYQCDLAPLHPALHKIRKQPGQAWAARDISGWLEGGNLGMRKRYSVQDPYSMRCAPIVHGATKQALDHCESIFLGEVNSVTDNPNVFRDEDLILSGGNFHAQPIALSLDYMAIALAELGNISERRTYLLLNGERDLPSCLIQSPGLDTGLMIAQYTAASMVSQNKQLCTPTSVDSISSSQGQEDHVSMAANGGTRMLKLIRNVYGVLAIEFMSAAQAISFRDDARLSTSLDRVYQSYREVVPFLKEDRVLHPDIEATIAFLKRNF